MQVEAHSEAACFDVLKEEWQQLVPHSQADLIFSTWEWHSHWWNAYHPGRLWLVLVRSEQGELVGLMPMFIETQPGRGRVARIVGSDDVTDYLDIIAHVGCVSDVYRALASFLAASKDFDALDMSNVPETSPTRTLFVEALEANGFTVKMTPQEVCPLFDVPATFEAYLELLDSKERSELRRKLRRAEAVDGLDWYIVGGQHDIGHELEKFLALMAASHPEKAAFLQNPQHAAFFRSFMPTAMARGWLQLAFQTYDDEPIAAYLNFDYNDHILVYNSGLKPDRYGALSPGIVLLANLIKWAIAHKKRTFNFLRGNEAYKYQMGGRDTTVYRIEAFC
jgi:CelD/BcsL family acetyltransferase involved in cellulose biosynthesis